MANGSGQGRWLLVQELLERGDPAFVDELRRFRDPEILGSFAERFFADRRPATRPLLLAYLERPLNAYRHEPLVKRLFKLAEKAGDDAVMARFLVLFDRSVRRIKRKRSRTTWHEVRSQEEALTQVADWQSEGYTYTSSWAAGPGRFVVSGIWTEEVLATPCRTVMPRGMMVETYGYTDAQPSRWKRFVAPDWALALKLDPWPFRESTDIPDQYLSRLERFRLFKLATRNYLRRRAWRYFRKLGKGHPERYVAAISQALVLYNDQDVADGLALIDNWGLMHALFHHAEAVVPLASGWVPAEGHSLAELAPAPMFEPLWRQAPRALFELLTRARCRPVRQWAIQMLRLDREAMAAVVSLEERLALVGHDDDEVAAWAAESLRGAAGLDRIEPERWLALASTSSPRALEIVCELMERFLRPERVSLGQAVRLACSRPLPLARLGFAWLEAKTPQGEADCRLLLDLVEAEAEPLRPEIVRWAREVLGASTGFTLDWVLAYLDSRHADVRAEGRTWFLEDPRARDDTMLWQRLLESPYDDVRLALVAELETRVATRERALADELPLDGAGALVSFLWASVLLNIYRGGRAKPVVVRQLVRRIEDHPEELPRLMPLLAVALRSVRGPEWRAGLAAVVQLAEGRAEDAGLIHQAFPELTWD
jgi:hypothetical protein